MSQYRGPSGSAVIAFRRGTTPPDPTTVLRPSQWSVRTSSVYAKVWRYYSSTSGGGTVYTISPTGSVAFGGSAPIQRTSIIVPSGQVVFSGAAPITRTIVISPTGQIVFGGAATIQRTTLITPSGNIQFQGGASIQYLANGVLVSEGITRVSIGINRTVRIS